MSSNDARTKAGNVTEPLLPIEKKLIGYSFGLSIVLLAFLVAINHLFAV